jgi:3-oxoacyl-[acyl-carrier-protein] synthase II
MSDVLITGLAVVSPLGHDIDLFWAGLLKSQVAIRPLDYPGTAVHGSLTYVVEDAPEVADSDGIGRASRFALAAAAAALDDAGIGSRDAEDVIGLCVGTGNGDSDLQEADRDGRRPTTGLEFFPYGTAGLLADRLGLYGPSTTVSTACAAGAYAVGLGADMITDGEADVVLVGGTEAVSRPAMGAFLRLNAADPMRCRPFDADRRGTVYGEGAAFLVLESAEHAAARGRRPYARVLGTGWSCDGYHATAPDPQGTQAIRAAHDAMHRAGIGPADIGAVICHGTGTPANDKMESHSMAEVFGELAGVVPAAAIKASLGHSGGAAGAFSCVTAVLVANRGLVPPIATLANVDPDCGLRVSRTEPEATNGNTVLVNAYAFGGNNISVLIGAAS